MLCACFLGMCTLGFVKASAYLPEVPKLLGVGFGRFDGSAMLCTKEHRIVKGGGTYVRFCQHPLEACNRMLAPSEKKILEAD